MALVEGSVYSLIDVEETVCQHARKLELGPMKLFRWRLTPPRRYVHMNGMHAHRLHYALQRLSEAILEVENQLAAMQADHDPLASHIFVSRRHYRNAHDTKSGKRREVAARLSYKPACELGFRGSFDEWEQLMGAAAKW